MLKDRLILTLASLLLLVPNAQSKPNPNGGKRAALSESITGPVTHRRIHYVGNVYAKISNDASIGQPGGLDPADVENQIVGHDAQFEFPTGSRNDYLFNGSLWVGGIVGVDTLVSESVDGASETAYEFNGFTKFNESSEPITGRQTYTAELFDTLVLPTTSDEIASRLHKPLGLAITQKSHAFRTSPFDAFVIVEYTIRNISTHAISDAYVGMIADADVWPQSGSVRGSGGPTDDLAGFLPDEWIGYAMDNDGDPNYISYFDEHGNWYPLPDTTWVEHSMRGAFAIAPVHISPTPSDSAFNWWATDFSTINWGPSLDGTALGTVGMPFGDVNRYSLMSNGERDYDQLYSAVDMVSEGWRAGEFPHRQANLADGLDTRLLISFGSFDLNPGDSILAVFVLAGGNAVHSSPTDYFTHFSHADPGTYYGTLDFSDLVARVQTARGVYESGFQLPGAPPVSLNAELVNDTSARCDWTTAPFAGVTGYRLYRRQPNGTFEFLVELDDLDTSYIDSGLSLGSTYEFGVSAIDSAGYETALSETASVTAGKPPVVPAVTAKSIRGKVNVDCIASTLPRAFSQPEYLNIYRRRENSPAIEQIRRYSFKNLRLVGGSLDKYTPNIADPARARDDEWSKGRFPYMEPPFFDTDVESGVRYYYSASVTNGLGYEGDRSPEQSALSMAMDRHGIVFYYTLANADAFVNRDSVRAFYGPWGAVRSFDSISFDFRLPDAERELVTSLEAISHYPVVVLVMEDYDPRFPRPLGEQKRLYSWLTDYWLAGGRVMMIARGSAYPPLETTPATVIQQFVGVGKAVRERIWEYLGAGKFRLHSRFEGADPIDPGFPVLDGDSAEAWDFQAIRNLASATPPGLPIGGDVPGVGFVDSLAVGTEPIYTFRSDQPDTSYFEGRVVGAKRITDSGSAILFSFPLSLLKTSQAWNALSIAVNDLGADTSWTSPIPDVNERSAILNWLYGPASAPPNPAWDINHDGVIDIRDVVEELNR